MFPHLAAVQTSSFDGRTRVADAMPAGAASRSSLDRAAGVRGLTAAELKRQSLTSAQHMLRHCNIIVIIMITMMDGKLDFEPGTR